MVEMPFENEAGRALEIYGFHKSVNAGRAAVYPPPRARASNSGAWISARLGRPIKKTPSPSPITVVAGGGEHVAVGARVAGDCTGRSMVVSWPEDSAVGCPSEPAVGWSSPVIVSPSPGKGRRDRGAATPCRWQRARVHSSVTASCCINFCERGWEYPFSRDLRLRSKRRSSGSLGQQMQVTGDWPGRSAV
jgi:hypothetical protein